MLVLDGKIELNAEAIASANLCDRFSDEDLERIGVECVNGYEVDEQSRETWMRRNEAGMDLALQVQKAKTFPWPNCSNIAFPLVTIAAMQFHARAYPALINGNQVVKCKVEGADPEGTRTLQANKISRHMNWQLLQQDSSWEEQEDKAILNLSIVGTNFKKTYYSPQLGRNVSELVLAKDLVVNYWSKSLDECPRKTHIVPKFKNEIRSAVLAGTWRDVLDESWYDNPPKPSETKAKLEQDKRQGVTASQPDATTSLTFLEQHVDMDLDDDGYAEPYIITVHKESKTVVRIVTRFDEEKAIEKVPSGKYAGKIIRVKANEYFTKKTFIPSPDGGIYDIGFGVFLGPLNETVSSLVNMLVDCGVMQTTAGGFLGRGAKFRSGTNALSPFEWKRVDATGDDLRKSILPAPVNAPSDVLFQLLSLLINYTSRVSGTTDTTVGENPGQNTPASSMQTMVDQGQKVYSAIFKRIWRSSKMEFQKLFDLNKRFLKLDAPQVGGVTLRDYLETKGDITPQADPTITSDMMRIQRATMLKQAAATTPGYNRDAVEIIWLTAIGIEDIEKIFKPGAQPAPNPDVMIAKMAVDGKTATVQAQEATKQAALQLKQAELQQSAQEFIVALEEERRVNDAMILDLQSKAMKNSAQAQSEEAFSQAAMIEAGINQAEAERSRITANIDHMLKAIEIASRHKIGMQRSTSNVD
jgi:chaperonin GroES